MSAHRRVAAPLLSQAPAEVWAAIQAAMEAEPMNRVGVEATRRRARPAVPSNPEEVETVADFSVGPHSIRVRTYTPNLIERSPASIFLHAGGWVLGNIDQSDSLCRRLANRASMVVVNVDYRLAPEHPYPAALDDVEAVFRWVTGNSEQLGVDPDRIAMVGESSGGNLAAAFAMRSKRLGMQPLAAMLLLTPALDAAADTPSWREMGADYPPVREQITWLWEQYLQSPAHFDDPEANTASSADLTGLPPAVIVSAGFDPLRDEAWDYADRLAAAGTVIDCYEERLLLHAFASRFVAVPQGAPAYDRAIDRLAAMMRPTEPGPGAEGST